MGSKGGSTKASLPTPSQLAPLLELQSKYNRVGQVTPFGSQTYSRNQDGSYNLNTQASPAMQGLIDRAQGLAMTPSTQMQAQPQLQGIESALAGRVGDRLGAPSKPQTQTPPPVSVNDSMGPR